MKEELTNKDGLAVTEIMPAGPAEDTIAAISTAFGEGGIGIVRISGPLALDILLRLFSAGTGLAEKKPPEPRKLTYGKIVDPVTGQEVDEVLAAYMPAPATYTREDVVEIHCHGSVVSLRKILALCLANGARAAEKGEFTKRAFLNGRLDLSQAEAVMDLISAKTDDSLQVAVDQLSGRLSRAVSDLRADILDVLVNVGVNMDYPDEDIEEVIMAELIQELAAIKDRISQLKETANVGKVYREGLHVAIVGRPNVGKSSLLNAFMGEERAIVTDIPGTTRDEITEYIDVGGIPLRLVDTAGIRDTEDTIEQMGIAKSQANAKAADLVLWVVDAGEALTAEDLAIAEDLVHQKVLVLLNKQDKVQTVESETEAETPVSATETAVRERLPKATVCRTVLKEGATSDISMVRKAISDLVTSGAVTQGDSVVVTNARHEALLAQAAAQLTDAIDAFTGGEALDIGEIDIRGAYESLGEILGETLKDDIIDEIFARFCLGK